MGVTGPLGPVLETDGCKGVPVVTSEEEGEEREGLGEGEDGREVDEDSTRDTSGNAAYRKELIYIVSLYLSHTPLHLSPSLSLPPTSFTSCLPPSIYHPLPLPPSLPPSLPHSREHDRPTTLSRLHNASW